MWKHVLQDISKTLDFVSHAPAVKFVVFYFVLQAQSARCEALLSRRSHIKRSLMGQGDAKLYNIYAQVQSNLEGGLQAGPATDLIKSVVARYAVASERRGAVHKSQVPMPGRARARLRAQHSDKGKSCVRKVYKKRKAQEPALRGRLLQKCSLKLRLLTIQGADEVDDIMKPDILQRRRNRSRGRASDCFVVVFFVGVQSAWLRFHTSLFLLMSIVVLYFCLPTEVLCWETRHWQKAACVKQNRILFVTS